MAQAQETQRASSKRLSYLEKPSNILSRTCPSLSCCQYCLDSTFLHFFPSVDIPCTKTAPLRLSSFNLAFCTHFFPPDTFFDQLDQTKQSPRNSKSAATQLWGNLKPVGIVRLVCGKDLWENPGPSTRPRSMRESWQMQQILGKHCSQSVFKISQKKEKIEDNDPNLTCIGEEPEAITPLTATTPPGNILPNFKL